MIDNVLSTGACEQMIQDCELIGFVTYNIVKDNHGTMQIPVSPEMADQVAQRLSQHINIAQVEELGRDMSGGTKVPASREDIRLESERMNLC